MVFYPPKGLAVTCCLNKKKQQKKKHNSSGGVAILIRLTCPATEKVRVDHLFISSIRSARGKNIWLNNLPYEYVKATVDNLKGNWGNQSSIAAMFTGFYG